MLVDCDTLVGGCGVNNVYAYDDAWDNVTELEDVEGGGAGWLVASFNFSEPSKEVWAYLSDKYKVVYKTPTRPNTNSGNMFFFAVFDTTQKPDGTLFNASVSE
jgi:hypothetical protein